MELRYTILSLSLSLTAAEASLSHEPVSPSDVITLARSLRKRERGRERGRERERERKREEREEEMGWKKRR